MKIITVEHKREVLSEENYFTPLFDMHLDFRGTDTKNLSDELKKRSNLKNHWCAVFGDLMDFILPSDPRFTAGNQKGFMSNHTAYINYCIDYLYEFLCDFKPVLISMGNHEYTLLKKSGINIVAMLCEKLGCEYGNYSGRLHFKSVRENGTSVLWFRLLYHHGAWGGAVIKGFSGARDYARHFFDWDIFLYGHNHQRTCAYESVDCITSSSKQIISYNKQLCFLDCGTSRGELDDEGINGPDYHTVKGLANSGTGLPLIKWNFKALRIKDGSLIILPKHNVIME